MNRITAFLIGPELIWVLFYGAAVLLVARNQPPTEEGSRQLESLWWVLAIASVLLSFVPLALKAAGSPWWMLLRIAIAGALGVIFVNAKICDGVDYDDSRNSGVGSWFILLWILGWLRLGLGLVIAGFYFLLKARAA